MSAASGCSSPTTTCGRPSPSPTAPTSSTTVASWPPAPRPSWPTTQRPGRSTWARSSRYETRTAHESTGRHDPAAPAGHPAPPALDPRARAGRAQGAGGEPAPRGDPGREQRDRGGSRGLHEQRGDPDARGDRSRPGGPRAAVEGDLVGRQRAGRRPALRPVLRDLRRPRRRAHPGLDGGARRAAVREPGTQRHLAHRAPDGAAAPQQRRQGGAAHRGGHHRQPRRGRLPAGRRGRGRGWHGLSRGGGGGRAQAHPGLRSARGGGAQRAGMPAPSAHHRRGAGPVSVEIVEKHFEDLERRRYAEIARAMKLPLERIMESIEEIQSLEPKPGRRFSANDSRYVVPDVTIQKVGEDYVVILNEEGIPRLRVNSLYRSLLRRSGDEAKQYVEQKLRSAVWLIKSVEQRQRTLRKVAQSLVNFQRDFLDKGLPFLRPLALRDVGDDISMHESTISRVTTNKYVQTPQGLFE